MGTKTGNTNNMYFNKPDFVLQKEFDYLKLEVQKLKQEVEELKNQNGNS